MPDLSIRSTRAEIMDDLNSPEQELRQNLHELGVINNLLGGYTVVLRSLDRLQLPNTPISIIDIGCGGGDMLRAVADWAKKKHKQVTLTGIDFNRVMINYGREKAANYPNISFKKMDVLQDTLLQEKADIITCSLFCHHFENDTLVALLQRMNTMAQKAVIINDLHRHWFAYHAISVLTALFSKTYMVKHDARLSVARAFKRKDWIQILTDAGITNYTLKWRWAWRWELVIRK